MSRRDKGGTAEGGGGKRRAEAGALAAAHFRPRGSPSPPLRVYAHHAEPLLLPARRRCGHIWGTMRLQLVRRHCTAGAAVKRGAGHTHTARCLLSPLPLPQLHGKSDLRFVEGVIKFAREALSIKSPLSAAQFLSEVGAGGTALAPAVLGSSAGVAGKKGEGQMFRSLIIHFLLRCTGVC